MTMRGGDRRVDLAAITLAASREAGGVPPGLLGDYLPAVQRELDPSPHPVMMRLVRRV